jgi:hypothetical protein
MAMLATLDACAEADGEDSRGKQMLRVLTSIAARARLDAALPEDMSSEARELLEQILAHHMKTTEEEVVMEYDAAGQALTHRILKPLRDIEKKRTLVTRLQLPEARATASFHRWLTERPEEERLRSIAGNHRILQGIALWDLSWMEGAGVVCYERAASRVQHERPHSGGAPGADFLKGVVSMEVLPTATANGGHHYVLVSATAEPRFLTVEEVSRAFGVPAASPVMAPLLGRLLPEERKEDEMTAIQAVGALGEGVHVGLCKRLVAMLADRGVIGPGMRYGSAFSGIDLVAAAVEEVFGANWTHCFASELDKKKRAALRSAWSQRGLGPDWVFWDARQAAATGAPAVDLWAMTASCKEFSQLRHHPTTAGQWSSLDDVNRSLDYVRTARPRAVLIENVTGATIVRPLAAMVGGITGYAWSAGVLSPVTHAEAPMERERFFVLGERLG